MADALGTLRRFLLLTGLYYAGAVLARFTCGPPKTSRCSGRAPASASPWS
jgi:hypothetical protein